MTSPSQTGSLEKAVQDSVVASREDARPQPDAGVAANLLPTALAGHWDTDDGREMALRYAERPRPAVNLGSDMALANAAYMHLHEPLGTATKERMRWLSVQMAMALVALHALLPEGWGDDDTMDHIPGVKLARLVIANAEGRS